MFSFSFFSKPKMNTHLFVLLVAINVRALPRFPFPGRARRFLKSPMPKTQRRLPLLPYPAGVFS